jgi:hypothetical protein
MESVLSAREVPESSKLHGTQNYALWSFKLRTLLQGERVWRVVDPLSEIGVPPPNSGDSSSATSSTTGKAPAAPVVPLAPATPTSTPSSAAATDIEDLKFRALRYIIGSVTDSLLPHVMHIPDPRIAWIRLRDLFEPKTMNRRLTLKSQLYGLLMTDRMSIEEHLRNVSTIVGQLANIGIVVLDEELVDRVLTSLPTSWLIFRQMITNREHPVSFAKLENLMIQEDGLHTRTRDLEGSEEAMFASRYNHRSGHSGSKRGRSHFQGRNSYQRGFGNLNHSGGGSNPQPNSYSTNGGSDHRSPTTYSRGATSTHSPEPTRFGNLYNPKGNCNHCESPFHWADGCDNRRLEDKIRDMELQLGAKKQTWANTAEINTCDTGHAPAYSDQLQALAADLYSPPVPDWISDSRASAHVTGERNLLSEIRPTPVSSITTARGQALPIIAHGTTKLNKTKETSPILYVPGMKKSLLSVGKLVDDGNYTLFGPRHCWVFDGTNPNKVILTGTRSSRNGLYKLNPQHRVSSSPPTQLPIHLATIPDISKSELWHQRLAHLNYQYLYNLSQRQMVTGLPPLPRTQHSCEACILGKQHRTPIPIFSTTPTTRLLELIHSDLCGPLPQRSFTGSWYILTFTDDYSHYSWIYNKFLATKNETFDTFKAFRRMVENQTRHKLSCLRTDRGGEYLSIEFTKFCKLHGIRHQLTTAGTPQQNGVAERKNRHLLETMRSLLFGAHLPTYLWEEAVRTANYISNRISTRALSHLTPHQRYTKRKLDISYLHLFGSTSYLYVQKGSKLEPKSRPMTLVGYDELSKAYRCFDPTRRKIVISRDVIFNENLIGIQNPTDLSSQNDDIFQHFLYTNLPQSVPDSVTQQPHPTSSHGVPDPNPMSPTLTHTHSPFSTLGANGSSYLSPSIPLPEYPILLVVETPPVPLCRSNRFHTQSVKLDDYILTISHDDFDICLAETNPEISADNLTYAEACQHPG